MYTVSTSQFWGRLIFQIPKSPECPNMVSWLMYHYNMINIPCRYVMLSVKLGRLLMETCISQTFPYWARLLNVDWMIDGLIRWHLKIGAFYNAL